MTDRIKKIVISLFITLQLVFFPAGNNIFAISIEEETKMILSMTTSTDWEVF
jgi:hypothetical protein